jgi:hypothetical protein
VRAVGSFLTNDLLCLSFLTKDQFCSLLRSARPFWGVLVGDYIYCIAVDDGRCCDVLETDGMSGIGWGSQIVVGLCQSAWAGCSIPLRMRALSLGRLDVVATDWLVGRIRGGPRRCRPCLHATRMCSNV